MRSLISLRDLAGEDVVDLTERAAEIGRTDEVAPVLAGIAVGLYFRRSSTRTRTSFWRAATRLGADIITYGPDDLQVVTGETTADTGRVLAEYLEMLVARTDDHPGELRELTAGGALSVVNALTRDEHPTQALADLATLREEFGGLSGLHLVYVGEGNSSAAGLALATARTPGLRLTVVTPERHGLPAELLAAVAATDGAADRVVQRHRIDDVDGKADAVYTSRWQTMGVTKQAEGWRDEFAPFQVNDEVFTRLRHRDTVFLHDLPAVRGEEVSADVLDGPDSRVWRQSFHKTTAAIAVLEWCAQLS